MQLTIPDFCLVVLIGASGAGKSHFARAQFRPTEILSSDFCRGLVSDDENDQSATSDAFEVLHYIAGKRLAARRLTVIDATNLRPEDRQPLVTLARKFHALPVAIVLDMDEKLCRARNAERPNRQFGRHVVRNHVRLLRRSRKRLGREGFRRVHYLSSPEEVSAAGVVRQRLWTDRRDETGPFDIIGDVHGCMDELEILLRRLGYVTEQEPDAEKKPIYRVRHPEGRRAFFVGDLVDRGPRSPDVLRLVMGMVADGTGLCVPGNHDVKLMRKLRGRDVKVAHGLAETLAQLEGESQAFKDRVADFVDGLVSHAVVDDGRLVVAHAGMKEEMQGRASGAVRAFALFGETTGETDEFGLPVRYDWAAEYRGKSQVVYGHTPVPEAEWLNRTICIDTGCVFGGKLTALRYPERELVSVPAAKQYFEPVKPLVPEAPSQSAQQEHDALLDIEDVLGKRLISTGLRRTITIHRDNATAALEVMSRFAIDPRWLIYLPPTMSPTQTSREPGLLEHPAEAFAYYQAEGTDRVVCEMKHMGSRAVVIVCRDETNARARFGEIDGAAGVVYTRTGRPFFNQPEFETGLLDRLRKALYDADFWDRFKTGWVCLDCELMPWSAKAKTLLTGQYAPVAASARLGLRETMAELDQATARGIDLGDLRARFQERRDAAEAYAQSYQPYCWPVASVDDLKLAPFHIMATEGTVHSDKDHGWHMAQLAELCAAAPDLLLATEYHVVDLSDLSARDAATEWWAGLTERGDEGMVVKPMGFVTKGSRGLAQPAVKCRGREYLRIIYGPEYTTPAHLERLRSRGLGRKRSLAIREFVLGLEALRRFVDREPLRRVHECVFGVLALESEPVDPRL